VVGSLHKHCRRKTVKSDDSDRDERLVLADNATSLGDLARSAGRFEEAMGRYRESLAIIREIVGAGATRALPSGRHVALLVKLADAERRCGQTVAARSHYLEAATELRRLAGEQQPHRSRRGLVSCLRRLGDLAKAGYDYSTARDHYAEALAMVRLDHGEGAHPATRAALITWLRLTAHAEYAIQSHEAALSLYRELAEYHQQSRPTIDCASAIQCRVSCCWHISACLDAINHHTASFEVTEGRLDDVHRLEALSMHHGAFLRTCRAFWIARRKAAQAIGRSDEAAIASRNAGRLRALIASRPGTE